MLLNGYGGSLNLLVSYPRSGNTWIRYCIEYLTKQLTIGSLNNPNPIEKGIGYCTDIGVDFSKDIILNKQHFIKDEQINNNKIIFILRNYKEVIVKQHYQGTPADFTKEFKKRLYRKYMTLLEKYNKWDENKRILIYYEDLINKIKIKSILKKILHFLDININITDFMNNYEYHKRQCVQLYETHIGTSNTKGNKEKHHSNKLKEYRHEWDDFLIEKYPDLFMDYLWRYRE